MNATASPIRDGVAALLPSKPIQEFPAKHVLYGPYQPCCKLYFVRCGRVAITSSLGCLSPVIRSIVGPGGLFGEASLISSADPSETSHTLDKAQLVSWSRAEVEQHISYDPRLGLLLIRYFAQRCEDLNQRLEARAFLNTPERVMVALLHLAERLGTPYELGIRMAPLTQQMIAEYVGTSREIVASEMAKLRRLGLVQYSRKFIQIDARELRQTLRQRGLNSEPSDVPLARAAAS